MHKGFLRTAALLGALSVGLGAFGAHALKKLVSEYAVATFETGVRYMFYHTLALLLVAIVYKEFPSSLVKWAGRLFIAGIIMFSGSLFGLTMVQGMVLPGFKWLGPITPLGGAAFIAGWICLLLAFWRKNGVS